MNIINIYGKKIGQLDTPADMKIFDKKIFVVEERNHRVQIFSIKGEPLGVFGTYGNILDLLGHGYKLHIISRFIRNS